MHGLKKKKKIIFFFLKQHVIFSQLNYLYIKLILTNEKLCILHQNKTQHNF